MSDDYLWDRTGAPDSEIQRLERVLGRLRTPPGEPAWPPLPDRVGSNVLLVHRDEAARASGAVVVRPRAVRTAAHRWPAAYLATAAALTLVCAAGLFTVRRSPAPSWTVEAIAGTPLAGTVPVRRTDRLALGEWLETDAQSRARLAVAQIGRVDVDPHTRLRLVATRDGHHRLALSRGTLHAFIWAPPGQFVVDTPSSRAVDLGCAYTLSVDPLTGAGLIEVTAGWVGFEYRGRESFIPAGARCATRRGVGPGTPRYADAPESLAAALDDIDFGKSDPGAYAAALDRAIAAARPQDAFTLWHLLSRVPAADRDRVYDALARVVPPPAGVTSSRVRAGDRAALDAWWDALDLGTTGWWRTWKRSWDDSPR